MLPKLKDYILQLSEAIQEIRTVTVSGILMDINEGIEEVVKTVIGQTQKGNKVILIGNGGSATIANHIAVDLWKNTSIKALSFSDPMLLTSISNDFGYSKVFEKPVEMFADEGDVLVAISSSGKSENIINGVEAARRKKCRVFTMSGFSPDNPLCVKGEINFYVPSNFYGHVEIAHLVLCHGIVDIITHNNHLHNNHLQNSHSPNRQI